MSSHVKDLVAFAHPWLRRAVEFHNNWPRASTAVETTIVLLTLDAIIHLVH